MQPPPTQRSVAAHYPSSSAGARQHPQSHGAGVDFIPMGCLRLPTPSPGTGSSGESGSGSCRARTGRGTSLHAVGPGRDRRPRGAEPMRPQHPPPRDNSPPKPERCPFSCCTPQQRGGTAPRSRVNHCPDRNHTRRRRAASHGRRPRARGEQRGEDPEPRRCTPGARPIRSHPCLSFRESGTSSPGLAPRCRGTVPGWEKPRRPKRGAGEGTRASAGHRGAPAAITPHPGGAQTRRDQAPGWHKWGKKRLVARSQPRPGWAQPRCWQEPGGPRAAPVLTPAHPGPALPH